MHTHVRSVKYRNVRFPDLGCNHKLKIVKTSLVLRYAPSTTRHVWQTWFPTASAIGFFIKREGLAIHSVADQLKS